uniref:Rubis-subs-bind domain-containing protein n=1 Tax=Steinernema glaseri TaxID=37863 RepID=A0A1I7Y224_9BILA
MLVFIKLNELELEHKPGLDARARIARLMLASFPSLVEYLDATRVMTSSSATTKLLTTVTKTTKPPATTMKSKDCPKAIYAETLDMCVDTTDANDDISLPTAKEICSQRKQQLLIVEKNEQIKEILKLVGGTLIAAAVHNKSASYDFFEAGEITDGEKNEPIKLKMFNLPDDFSSNQVLVCIFPVP